MIASPSIAFDEMSGSAKGVTAAKTRGRKYIRNRGYGVAAPAAAITSLQTPVATAINIKADYDAKNGTPTAGNPNVFFRYFYVNTATGEKSADMCASAKLSA